MYASLKQYQEHNISLKRGVGASPSKFKAALRLPLDDTNELTAIVQFRFDLSTISVHRIISKIKIKFFFFLWNISHQKW